MKTPNTESGSALILVIGVIAALATLAAAMVMLLGNVQANTARDRAQKTSFSVSEAAVDAAMAQLSDAWFTADTPFDRDYLDSYLGSLSAAGYAPAEVYVTFYDNSGTGGGLGTTAGWDSNGDNRLWVEAAATTNKRTTRVRVLVERQMLNLGLLDNIAVWTGGTLDKGSSASSVSYEVLGPGATTAIVQYNMLADTPHQFDPLVITQVSPATPANELFTPGLRTYLRAEAARIDEPGVAKLYTGTGNVIGTISNLAGLVYVDSGAASSRQLPIEQKVNFTAGGTSRVAINGDGVGSHPAPGVLIVDAKSLQLVGNVDYYGLIFCTGAITIQSGFTVHGMVLAAAENVTDNAITLLGSNAIVYNDNVRANLDREYSVSVHMVANTWRELGATPTPAP